jgi:PAS domain S-box-containing protein
LIHSSSRSGILPKETVIITETVLFITLLVTLVLIFLRARQTAAVRSIDVHLKPELTTEIGLDETTDLHLIAQRLVDALEKALQKERAIADYSPHFICSVDKEYRFIALGQSSLAITTFMPEELCGAPLSMLVHPEDLREFTRFLQQSTISDAECTFDTRIKTKDSRSRDLTWMSEWSEAEQAFYCIGQDVTGQRELERMRKHLADMLSHDVKSPLAAVKTALGLMVLGTYGPMPVPAQEQLEKSLQTVNRLLLLIQQTIERERQQQLPQPERPEQPASRHRA